MSRKKPDIYEQEKQMRREAYNRSLIVKEMYPQVAKIIVDMKFKEPDWGGDPDPRQSTYSQESKAFFKIDCPHVECISGGFDLSTPIDKLVASRLEKVDGTITCQGWQDKERINKHRCLLKLNYTISAYYINND
jgi:hypothetical protein